MMFSSVQINRPDPHADRPFHPETAAALKALNPWDLPLDTGIVGHDWKKLPRVIQYGSPTIMQDEMVECFYHNPTVGFTVDMSGNVRIYICEV